MIDPERPVAMLAASRNLRDLQADDRAVSGVYRLRANLEPRVRDRHGRESPCGVNAAIFARVSNANEGIRLPRGEAVKQILD